MSGRNVISSTEIKIEGKKIPKTNLEATLAPTQSNDSSQGYSVGSMWINIAADEKYICVDDTVGSAKWINPYVSSSMTADKVYLGSGQEVEISYNSSNETLDFTFNV